MYKYKVQSNVVQVLVQDFVVTGYVVLYKVQCLKVHVVIHVLYNRIKKTLVQVFIDGMHVREQTIKYIIH